MITPCSGRIGTAPPSRPPVVLRLSATSGTRRTPSDSITPVTRAARIVAPGFMFTLPSGLSSSPSRTSYGPRAPYRGAIAVDADTGRVLFADNMRTPGYPASVTKLMTFLLVLEDMHAMKYSTVDEVTATVRCTREKPSVCGLKPGMKITVDELLFAMLVHSSNDAAVLLAENSTARNAGREIQGGDLQAFVQRMNEKAKVTFQGEFEPGQNASDAYETSLGAGLAVTVANNEARADLKGNVTANGNIKVSAKQEGGVQTSAKAGSSKANIGMKTHLFMEKRQ